MHLIFHGSDLDSLQVPGFSMGLTLLVICRNPFPRRTARMLWQKGRRAIPSRWDHPEPCTHAPGLGKGRGDPHKHFGNEPSHRTGGGDDEVDGAELKPSTMSLFIPSWVEGRHPP